MNSRKPSIDYDFVEFDEEQQPGLIGSLQEIEEEETTCRLQDCRDMLYELKWLLPWIPSFLACVPETFENIIGIKSLPSLFPYFGGISLEGDRKEVAAYMIGFLGFFASVISSGRYVKSGISAIKDLVKREIPEDWTHDLSKRQEVIAVLLGCLCVVPSSLYDCLATVYCGKTLHLSEELNYTLSGLAWFSNISSEGIESYGNIRDLVKWEKSEITSKKMKALYYGLGGTIGFLGAIQDMIEVYCPVVALSKAAEGSSLQRLILFGAIPKLLTSNFYVGQWTRDALKEFAERLGKGQFTLREVLTFCFSFFYAFVLAEAKRGLTTSFLKSPGAELPLSLNMDWIEAFGGFVLLREIINNTKFIYPMVNEVIDSSKRLSEHCKKKRHIKPVIVPSYISLPDEEEYYSNKNAQTLFQPTNARLPNGHVTITINPPTLVSQKDENAKVLPVATKSAARV